GFLGGVVRGYIAPDSCRQERIRFGSDTCQASEFQLEVHTGIRRACSRADEVAAPDSHPPAAGTVLEAGEALQRLVILNRVDAAHEDIPGVADRPGARDLGLFQHIPLVAVADVDD